jgi:nicotinamide-nucleotide amidase
MELELVTVGTELLLGHTVDTNAAEIAEAVAAIGVCLRRCTTVGDDGAAIADAVSAALGRAGTVIVTGGLGPTRDDVTKRAVAGLYEVPLELDRAYLTELEGRFARLRRGPMPESNRSQAEIPRGASRIPNPRGTAQGLVFDGAPGTAVLLPGVPHEMRAMLRDSVVPLLARRLDATAAEARVVRSLMLRTTGITESGLADALAPFEQELRGVTLAYLPGWDGVDLRLTTAAGSAAEADRLLEMAASALEPGLGDRCYGRNGEDLAAVILGSLRAIGWTLATAESCTGGLVGGRLTAVPGASHTYLGGVVSYANASKVRDLDVPQPLLERQGAVSEAVVAAMAAGAAKRFGTDAAIAVTGVAGPEGGTPEKPVGMVWLAACAGGYDRTACVRFPGGRDEVRRRSVQAALDLLRGLLGRVAKRPPAT